MLIALIARDKPDALQTRLDTRAAHLEYIAQTGCVVQAGPLLNDADEMIGSLVVLEVDSRSDAQDWADGDPYAKAGLFASVELIAWKKVIG